MPILFQSLYDKVLIVLDSKIEEFKYYGYKEITKHELWSYCINKKWRKANIEQLRLYEVVETIYHVSASEMMNYLQVTKLKEQQSQPLVIISQEEMEFLLNPMQNCEEDLE